MKQDNGEERLSKWTQQLHDKLAEHETAAPDGLWADIEAALATEEAAPVPAGSSRARFVALRRWAAAAAVAAMFVGGGLLLYNNNVEQEEANGQLEAVQSEPSAPEEEPLTAQKELTEQEEQIAQKEPTEQEEQIVQKEPTMLVAKEEQPKQTVLKVSEEPLMAEVQPEKFQGDDESQEKDETSAEDPVGANPVEAPADVSPEGTADSAVTPSGQTTPKPADGWRPQERCPARIDRQLSLGLYAMNSLGAKDNSNAVMMADGLARNYTNTLNEASMATARRQAPIFLSGYEEQQHHYQPVAFGLTVDYPLTNRLSLTSGVVYTRLRSDFTQIIRSQQISQEQTLHYVGLPLSLICRLWRQGAFRAYVSAGMQADWNVSARQDAEGVERHIERDRMQWSANASVGLQYNILPQIALYAEPGINHYFDNGSSVQNFFKDKPTSLKLQMGIRLDLQPLR